MAKRKTDEEEAFPRGRPEAPPGAAASTASPAPGAAASSPAPAAAKKARKASAKGKKGGKKAEADDKDIEETRSLGPRDFVAAPRLRQRDIAEGSLFMAAVREVTDEDITLNLPYNHIGYAGKSQAFEEELASGSHPLPRLTEVYRPGQLVVVVVKGLISVGKGQDNRFRIEVSLRPSLANAGLAADTMTSNMTLPAVVQDDEEHVLRLNFGIPGMQGLLKKKEIADLPFPVCPGVILQVSLQSVNSSAGTARCTLQTLESMPMEPLKLESLKAGFLVYARVDKVLGVKKGEEENMNEGIVTTFCSSHIGLIHVHHQGAAGVDAPVIKYKQRVSARVLAVVPGDRTVIHLSLMPHLLDWTSQRELVTRAVCGQRLTAEALHDVPHFGVMLRCPVPDAAKGKSVSVGGFLPSTRIADKGETTKAPEQGAHFDCRVLGHNFLDATVVVTRRPYDLREDTVVSVNELTPGELVKGTVIRATDFGVFVKLSEYISGLVHVSNLTDVPLKKVSEKRFPVDSQVKCRVLRVFPEKGQVSFTAKRMMVKDSFQLKEWTQIRRGMLVTGFVSKIQPYGAIVSFYGDIFGLIPAKEMDADSAPAMGMAVKVRVESYAHSKKRLSLSLNLEGGSPPEELLALKASAGARRRVQPGAIVTSVRLLRVTEDGAYFRYQEKAQEEGTDTSRVHYGYALKAHLSDDAEEVEARHKELAKLVGGVKSHPEDDGQGDGEGADMSQEGVVLASRYCVDSPTDMKDGSRLTLLTFKPTMLTAAVDGVFLTDFANIEEGAVYSGFVKLKAHYGALVSIGAFRLSGLVPKSVGYMDELVDGMSVDVQVCNVDMDGQRFMAKIRGMKKKRRKETIVKREVGDVCDMVVQKTIGNVVTLLGRGGQHFGHLHITQAVDLDKADGSNPMEGYKFGQKIKVAVMSVSKVAGKMSKQARKDAEAEMLSLQKDGKNAKEKHQPASTEGKDLVQHMLVTARPSLLKEGVSVDAIKAANPRWRKLKAGDEVVGVITSVSETALELEIGKYMVAHVQARFVSRNEEVRKDLREHFKIGQVHKAKVQKAVGDKIMLRMHDGLGEGETQVPCAKGDKVQAKLVKVEEKVQKRGMVALFKLPGKVLAEAHITELFDFWAQNPMQRLKRNSMHEVAVLDMAEGKAEVSMRASLAYGRKCGAGEERPLAVDDLKVGQKVSGYVVNSCEKGVFVALSRTLTGRIQLKALSERITDRESVQKLYPPGYLIKEAMITAADVDTKRIEMSLKSSGKSEKVTADQVSVGDTVSGRVRAVMKYGIFVRLDNSRVDGLVHVTEVSDSKSVSLDSFKEGDAIRRAKVLKLENGKLWLGIKPSLFEGDEALDEDMDEEPEDEEAVEDSDDDMEEVLKAARAEAEEEDSDEEDDKPEEAPPAEAEKATGKKRKAEAAKEAPAEKKAKEEQAKPAAAPDDSDDEAAPWDRAAAVGGKADDAAFVFSDFKANMPSDSEDEEDDADGDDDEASEKKLSKRQKKAAKAAATEEVRKREAEIAEGRLSNDPRSVEDFERMLLTQGNVSIVWIKYMAFHLKMSDLEKARQVAERAVKHVGFSDAQERFNAWVSYMNLECTFGTEESAEALFKRAVAHNDAKQVYLQLAQIHARGKKPQLATKAFEGAAKKFPESKAVWLAFIQFLYEHRDLDGARKTLPRALAVLPRLKHPMVVSKTGLLEYAHGTAERGQSIFEGLLDSYPKRTDLWSVYLDAHIKAFTPPQTAAADLQEIRGLLERCCTLSLKALKMRFFFKRWLDFEKKWGDEESQEKVRARARAYVEGQA